MLHAIFCRDLYVHFGTPPSTPIAAHTVTICHPPLYDLKDHGWTENIRGSRAAHADVMLPVGGEGHDYDTACTLARSLIFGRRGYGRSSMAKGLYLTSDGQVLVEYSKRRRVPISFAQYKANGYKPPCDKLAVSM